MSGEKMGGCRMERRDGGGGGGGERGVKNLYGRAIGYGELS